MIMKQDTLFVKKLFMRFLLPALFSSLALAVGSVADSLYVGSKLGESGLFIIGSAYPLYMVFTTLTVGMASGGAVHFNARLGEGKEEEARRIFFATLFYDFCGICLLAALGLALRDPLVRLLGARGDGVSYQEFRGYVTWMLVCSPVLFLQAPLQYFVYADGNPKLASAALVAGNVCDCVCGFLFIVVFDMGVNGSVFSTLCGALVMEGICLIHFFRGKGALGFRRCGKPSLRTALRSLYTGFSTAAVYLYQFVTVLVFNRILLGMSGEWAVAVYDVVYNAGSIAIAVTEGVSMAMVALVSTFYGERNENGIRGSLRLSLISCFVLTALAAGGMAVAARPYCSLFGISAQYGAQAAYAMRLYMASMAFACVNGVIGSYCQSTGAERFSYLVTGLRTFAFLLLFGGLLSLDGYNAFWLCYLCAEAAALLTMLPFLLRRKRVLPEGTAVFSETFSGGTAQISDLCERLQTFLDESGVQAKRSYFVALSADETLRLICEASGELSLQLTLIVEEEECVLHLRDNAKRFNPFELSEENALGLKIVKNKAKDFHYRRFVGFNTLTVTF